MAATGSAAGVTTSDAVLVPGVDGVVVCADVEVVESAAANDPALDCAETVARSPAGSAPLASTEPRLVCALTVDLASADTVSVEPDADEDSEADADVAEGDAPPVDVVSPDEAAVPGDGDAELERFCGPGPLVEAPDDDDGAGDDGSESSASALAASGATSEAPSSAALIPADAAPTCSHRRTRKFWDRSVFRRFRPTAMF